MKLTLTALAVLLAAALGSPVVAQTPTATPIPPTMDLRTPLPCPTGEAQCMMTATPEPPVVLEVDKRIVYLALIGKMTYFRTDPYSLEGDGLIP